MIFFFFFLFIDFFMFFFLSLLLQCKFANLTLLSLLSFSYFITPYDAQASSAFSALIFFVLATSRNIIEICYLSYKPVLIEDSKSKVMKLLISKME